VTILAVYGIYWLLTYLSDALVPFAVAFLLAYLLNPIVTHVQRRITHRAAAVGVTLAGVLVICLLGLLALIPMVTNEMRNMASIVRKVSADSEIGDKIQNAFKFGKKTSRIGKVGDNKDDPSPDANLDSPENPDAENEAAEGSPAEAPHRALSEVLAERLQENLQDYFEKGGLLKLLEDADLPAIAQMAFNKLLPGAQGLFRGALSLLAGLAGMLVIFLYMIFMLLEYQRVKGEWETLIPPRFKEPILVFVNEFDVAMSRHFRAQAVVAALVGLFFSAGFVMIGLPMGILLGLFVGLLNMVPYLQILGIIPAALLGVMKALQTDGSIWWQLLLVLVVFGVVQLIQDGLLTPKIMGDVTGMSPAMILLSISVWGKLLGFLGLVIALPMTCLALAYYRRVISSLMTEEDETNRAPPDEPEEAEPDGDADL
jgi:predicted PurR-regulated permease PerM